MPATALACREFCCTRNSPSLTTRSRAVALRQMDSLAAEVRARVAKPGMRKLIRYSMVSVIAVAITVVLQAFCFGVLRLGPTLSPLIASTIAAVPSYILNRRWVWKKGGRSHIRKEVLPFWVMVVIGLVASTSASTAAGAFAVSATDSHAAQTVIVTGASFFAFAGLWILKFIIFNKVLFVHREDELDPAFDGRAGLPT